MIKSVYKLDKRIKDVLDIQSSARYDDSFIGEVCYFANSIWEFEDLESCDKGTLSEYIEDGYCSLGNFTAKEFKADNYYTYFIPEKLLKPVEKKYRPFTGIEFAEKFECMLGKVIRLREIPSNSGPSYQYKIVLTGFRWSDGSLAVFINGCMYDLQYLLKTYEYYENGEWHKFGVLEDD